MKLILAGTFVFIAGVAVGIAVCLMVQNRVMRGIDNLDMPAA